MVAKHYVSLSYPSKPGMLGCLLGPDGLVAMGVSQCPDRLLKAPVATGQGTLPPRKMCAVLKMKPGHYHPWKQGPACAVSSSEAPCRLLIWYQVLLPEEMVVLFVCFTFCIGLGILAMIKNKQVKHTLYSIRCHPTGFVYVVSYQFKPHSAEIATGICFLKDYLKNVSVNNTAFHHRPWNCGCDFCVRCDKLGSSLWKCWGKPRVLSDLPAKSPSIGNLNKDPERDSGSKPQLVYVSLSVMSFFSF